MHKALFSLLITALFFTGCNKSSGPGASAKNGDAVQQKLQEIAGKGATDCGRLTSQAPDQMKTASDCVMQAAQGKRPFYVAYDLPGMTVAVAGSSDGKLYSVNSTQSPNAEPGKAPELKSEPCPSELRLAPSGRITCFAPGTFGGGAMGGVNPHGGMPTSTGGMENPHGGAMPMPPPGTPNPHAGNQAKPETNH